MSAKRTKYLDLTLQCGHNYLKTPFLLTTATTQDTKHTTSSSVLCSFIPVLIQRSLAPAQTTPLCRPFLCPFSEFCGTFSKSRRLVPGVPPECCPVAHTAGDSPRRWHCHLRDECSASVLRLECYHSTLPFKNPF